MRVRCPRAAQRAFVSLLAVALVGLAAAPGLAGSHQERRLADR